MLRPRAEESTLAENFLHSRRPEPPFRHQAVGWQAAVQRAGGDAITIRQVPSHNRAQALQIEVGVFQLQRVEGPFHKLHATLEGVLPLEELQLPPDAAIAMRLQHGRHVRMQVWSGVAHPRQGHREPDQLPARERPQHLPASLRRDHKQRQWHAVNIRPTPNAPLQLEAPLKLGQAVAVAHLDFGIGRFATSRTGLLASHLRPLDAGARPPDAGARSPDAGARPPAGAGWRFAFEAFQSASRSSRLRSPSRWPLRAACSSISRKRAANFLLAFFSATSGSMPRKRATLTATKSRSPTSSST